MFVCLPNGCARTGVNVFACVKASLKLEDEVAF